MTEEHIRAAAIVAAPVDVVFDLLADPSTHESIDGTRWVREPLDGERLTRTGQIFRMGMYHDNHPDKNYEMANLVTVLDRPSAIAWRPGTGPDGAMTSASAPDDDLDYGGWEWRYDLEPVGGDQTKVVLTYDWSQVPASYRDIEFPPFEPEHLDNSLRNLAALAENRATAS